tara:strand:+ start:1619 stop:2212 length:594 start_codon:yes stop_codon:yes gene_type:complete
MKSQPKEYYKSVHTPKSILKFWSGTYKLRSDILFEELEDMLPEEIHVLDLAAGSSYMAEKFLELENLKSYTWNDFNPVLIDVVKSRVSDPRFVIDSFDAEDKKIDFSKFNVFICVSLEHLVNDFSILERLPEGCVIGICSPNFGGEEHVRFFSRFSKFKKRYKYLMDVKGGRSIKHSETRTKFILYGKRNKRMRKSS